MSRNKASKRRYSDPELECPNKRAKAIKNQERLQNAIFPAKSDTGKSVQGGKNIAANRLHALRQGIKKASESPKTNSKVNQSNSSKNNKFHNNVNDQGNSSKYNPKPSSSTLKSKSANERFKRVHQSSNHKEYDDDTIIEIDDSPLPASKREKQPKRPSSIVNIKDNNNFPEEKDSFRLSQSFVVVSEVSGDESTCEKSSTNSKTLTPQSIEGASVILVSTPSPSKGLRVPLKRNIFKTPSKEAQAPTSNIFKRDSPGKNNIISPTSHNIFKRSSPSDNNIFKSPLLSPNVGDNNKSPRKETFTSRNDSDSRKRKSSLANRLSKIRNQVSGHSTAKQTTNIDSPVEALLEERDQMIVEAQHEQLIIPKIVVPSMPKSSLVEQWMDSVNGPSNIIDQSTSDSMFVNVDDTFFNKTELLTEPQDDNSMEWDTVPEQMVKTLETNKPPEVFPADVVKKENLTCLVIDTNVFLHNLSKIRELLNFKPPGNQKLKIYIPWMVMQELDHFKDLSHQCQVKSLALAAQKVINKELLQSESKIIGQSVDDLCQQKDLGKCPDDKILACCLQAKEKFESVILLSNDVSLCNKALTNNLKAFTPKDIMGKLRSNKLLKIKVRLQSLLSQIIFQCCKDAYGEACTKMEMLQGSPWPFDECLKRFKKYWSPVFSQLLLKQTSKTIDHIIDLTKKGEISDNSGDLCIFKDKVREFLFYLQDIPQFNASVKTIINEIEHIVSGDSV